MTETKETAETIMNVKAVRLSDFNGEYHFYSWFSVTFIPAGPKKSGFVYLLEGSRFSRCWKTSNDDFSEVLREFDTPEAAWGMLQDLRDQLEASSWRLNSLDRCFMDPEGIRFALTGEVLP